MFVAPEVSTLFVLYVAAIAAVVAITLVRSLSGRGLTAGLGTLSLWVGYAASLGAAGIVANAHLPVPGVVILVAPIALFIAIVLGRSRAGQHLAVSIPLKVLIGLQVFRVGVEVTIHQLWELGLVPKLMTLSGGNIDILIGVSAPFIAWIASRGFPGRRIALAWNVIGLASLINVAARAVLSAPGPLHLIHGDVLNTAFGAFPFTFIPGFMAPLAMMLHVLTFRAMCGQIRTTTHQTNGADPAFS